MSIVKNQILASLSPPLPQEIIGHLLDEYIEMKQHFALGKFRPNELNGGRFAESILRLFQHFAGTVYTPYGSHLPNTNAIINGVVHNTALHDSIRLYMPQLTRTLLDVRNRRDVAHVGGDVNPNYSDSVFVTHIADWILTELVRIFYRCHIDSAKKVVESLNEVQIPLITDVDGFIRVQNHKLSKRDMVLALMYHQHPSKVRDSSLVEWTRYSVANAARFKADILRKLDAEAFIHYNYTKDGFCTLLPKGIVYVEKYVSLALTI